VVSNGITKARKLQQYLEGDPNIISSAISSHTFEPGSWTQIGWMDEQENRYNFYFNTVTENYIPTLGIEMVAGRNFSESNAADERRSIIVNEAFVKEFNLENPIGARLPGEEFDDNEIIGVVRDFHIQSLHVKIAPLVLARNVNLGFSGAHSVDVGSDASPKLAVRIAAGKTQEAIASIRDKWNEVYAGEPFDYQFIDENLKRQYTSEANLGKIISSATILAVFIGCLGLFGLSTLTMTSRLREVSIRKVLGASGKNLLLSLNKGFVILIILSIVIASPFTYYAMSEWLTAFEYKIEISPMIFILAGAIAMMVSLLTVSYQSLRAIHTNPAQALRME
jgi:putative ABC transport system permease protein